MNRSAAWTHIYAAAIVRGCNPRDALELANTGLAAFMEKFRLGSDDQDSAMPARSRPTLLEEFVTRSLTSYLHDPASSNYQRGFLAALIQVAEELIIDDQAPMLEELKGQLGEHEPATTFQDVLNDLNNERISLRTIVEGYIESIS